MHRAGIKQQFPDALSRLIANSTDKTALDDSVPDLVVTSEIFTQEGIPLKQDEDKNVTSEQTVDRLVPFIPEVVKLPDQVQESGTNILNLPEPIKHWARDNDCHQAAITVGKRNKSFSYNVDGILVRVSLINSASQKYIRAVLCTHSLRL